MPTFVLPRPVPVHDLGVESGDAIWLGASASSAVAREAVAAGLAIVASTDAIVPSDGAVVSADALRRFRAASEGVPGDVVGRLEDPVGAWCDEPAFGPPARLYRLRGGGGLDPVRIARATPIDVPVEHRRVAIPMADAPGGRTVDLALSDAVLCSTHHYAGLLWANLLALGPALWGQLVGRNPLIAGLRLGWAFARRRTTDPFVLAGALNRIERGARVHPSAVVEGCWVRAGARVGPGAVVRASILGEGASVEPLSLVAFSVLGPGAHVQRMGWAQFSVLHSGSAHAGAMQLGVLGPGASVKGGSYLLDQGPSVRARVGDALHPVPLGMLGVGVGARALIGSGVWIAPGRAVPPGITLVGDRVLTAFPT